VCNNCVVPKKWCIPVINQNPESKSMFENVKIGKLSKKCYKIISSIYERPFIFITKHSPLLKELTFLKQFLALKKKLLIIFDIVCRPSLIIKALSQPILHWLFPGNILSLADIHALFVSQGENIDSYNRNNNFFTEKQVQELEYSLFDHEKDEYPQSLSEYTMDRLEKFNSSHINTNSIIKLSRILVRLFKVHLFKCYVSRFFFI
jgi:hypothetical protein